MSTLEMLQWQQAKESGILTLAKNLPIDVTFFLLDRTWPPAERKRRLKS